MWLVNYKRIGKMTLIVLLVIAYISSHLLSKSWYSNEVAKLQERLKRFSAQLIVLRKKHGRLISRAKRFPGLRDLIDAEDEILADYQRPTIEYEIVRRRIYSNTKEMWYYLSHQVRKASSESLRPDIIKTILKEVANRKRSLLFELEKLPALDGYEAWRRQESASVSNLVQHRLHHLQHPRDCRTARKLLCQLDQLGLDGQLHRLILCLIYAYATESTLLDNNGTVGWNYLFEPLPKTCTGFYNETLKTMPVDNITIFQVIGSVPLNQTETDLYRDFKPYYIPKDIVHRITRFNGDPLSWWIGQVLKYIFKQQTYTQQEIDRRFQKMTFKHPIVGVLVLRKGVIKEVEYHDIDEYMSHVDDYYAQLELKHAVDERRVYFATDDPRVLKLFFEAGITIATTVCDMDGVNKKALSLLNQPYFQFKKMKSSLFVIATSPQFLKYDIEFNTNVDCNGKTISSKVLKEAIGKYPQYIFYSHYSNVQQASKKRRYASTPLTDQIFDLHMLTLCDHVVLTLNSNVGRLVYLLRQKHHDASNTFSNVDHIYYLSSHDEHFRIAAIHHKGGLHDIAFDIGDLIDAQSNCNGIGNGTSIKSKISGLFPWFKTMDYIVSYPLAEYKQVSIYPHSESTGYY